VRLLQKSRVVQSPGLLVLLLYVSAGQSCGPVTILDGLCAL
jgi:hypothetical protein